MAERGITSEVVCSPGVGLTDFANNEGVAGHAVSMTRAVTPIHDVAAVWKLVRVLRSSQPDVVHAHTPKGGLVGMVAARLVRSRVRVYHIHGLPHETARGLKRLVLMTSEWMSCHLATEVLAVSKSVLEVAWRDGVCPPNKGVVLEAGSINGVDARWFDPKRVRDASRKLRTDLGMADDALAIGFVGRLVKDKGIEDLDTAWTELREGHPSAVLLLVGKLEDGDPLPRDVVDRLQKDERVFFAGHLLDPAPAYALMSVLAFPSRREGFGLAAIEASAMSIPVVASRIAGLCDAVVDGMTGTLVPAYDATALTCALHRYLDDPPSRYRHGAAGRERAVREFAPQAIWAATAELYASLTNRRG